MPVGSTWSKSRSACCAANAWIAGSTTPTASSAKSPHGRSNETTPALASNGCSQPKRPAPKWAAPIPSPQRSHNLCTEVLVPVSCRSRSGPGQNSSHQAIFLSYRADVICHAPDCQIGTTELLPTPRSSWPRSCRLCPLVVLRLLETDDKGNGKFLVTYLRQGSATPCANAHRVLRHFLR